ncbi:hypothetical protein EGY07_11900 [Chryseobacterium indologenes]|jgi:hypothetical protein|uniref:hypothetical protein n=1 Tax=Chryseobacterium TaxID=59732 RepID=UPI000484852E|nr:MULTISPECIES: hypothetical protein [Chryseobacterium]AYZ36236.1 hypothetical protein EGY07_11900 [Chryseobacterium indologenes]MEB4760866.1 hypothetical protein [Chryseobacterium indologenes]RQO35313.1 hypothetical protein DBR39_18515 [Chryseobacterium sp. KBW03]
MFDTIGQFEEQFNKQVFRITFKNRDFQVLLLKRDLTKNMSEFQILLDGLVQRLKKENGKWNFEHGEDQDLAEDIWRQIALRYRF